jgi:hypothetical protein
MIQEVFSKFPFSLGIYSHYMGNLYYKICSCNYSGSHFLPETKLQLSLCLLIKGLQQDMISIENHLLYQMHTQNEPFLFSFRSYWSISAGVELLIKLLYNYVNNDVLKFLWNFFRNSTVNQRPSKHHYLHSYIRV